MFWWLRHKLFGTDFVAVQFGGNDCIRAIQVTPNGRSIVRIYGDIIRLHGDDKDGVYDSRYVKHLTRGLTSTSCLPTRS